LGKGGGVEASGTIRWVLVVKLFRGVPHPGIEHEKNPQATLAGKLKKLKINPTQPRSTNSQWVFNIEWADPRDKPKVVNLIDFTAFLKDLKAWQKLGSGTIYIEEQLIRGIIFMKSERLLSIVEEYPCWNAVLRFSEEIRRDSGDVPIGVQLCSPGSGLPSPYFDPAQFSYLSHDTNLKAPLWKVEIGPQPQAPSNLPISTDLEGDHPTFYPELPAGNCFNFAFQIWKFGEFWNPRSGVTLTSVTPIGLTEGDRVNLGSCAEVDCRVILETTARNFDE
jgi:hypothetical protein